MDQACELAATAELVLELLDATSSIDETLLTSKGRVRISSNITDHDLVFGAVDSFSLATTHSGLRQELMSCRDVDERDRIELRMEISFHSKMPSNKVVADWRSFSCLV